MNLLRRAEKYAPRSWQKRLRIRRLQSNLDRLRARQRSGENVPQHDLADAIDDLIEAEDSLLRLRAVSLGVFLHETGVDYERAPGGLPQGYEWGVQGQRLLTESGRNALLRAIRDRRAEVITDRRDAIKTWTSFFAVLAAALGTAIGLLSFLEKGQP